jgi:ABC-type phosphate transport system substrate-binding protein
MKRSEHVWSPWSWVFGSDPALSIGFDILELADRVSTEIRIKMREIMDRPTIAIAAVTVLAFLSAVGCRTDSNSEEHASSPNAPKNVISGAGSTFVSPLMTAWVDGYQRAHPGFIVNYHPIGSGRGIDEFKKGWYAFAASDAPLTDDEMRDIPSTIQVPTTAGSVCLIYNLPGLERPLRLTSATLAGIFLGTITNWEDRELSVKMRLGQFSGK